MTGNISDKEKDGLNWLSDNLHCISPEPVVKYLYANKALSSLEMKQIKDKATKTGQTISLLKTVEKQKVWVYYCLLDGLHKSGQESVIDILKEGIILSEIYIK